MIPSPKERFLANARAAKEHADLVANPSFQHAVDTALRVFAEQCDHTDGADAGYWRTRGAFEFVRVLNTLHELPVTRGRKDFDNLHR